MLTTTDLGNLLWSAISHGKTVVTQLLSGYGILLIGIPMVYQRVRCRSLNHAQKNPRRSPVKNTSWV